MSPRAAVGAACLLGLAALAAAQQDFSKVRIRAEKLADTVWMLTGSGGNLAVSAGEDGVLLVDDQYAPLTERITAAIGELTPKPVRFVLNTHWHGDHVGGNVNLANAGAVIVAQDNVRTRLATEQYLELWRATVKPLPKAGLPVITFPQEATFHLNGEAIRVFHVPRAHTDGDAVVHFTGSDVIHTGDVFWNRLYPLIDTGAGGTLDGMIAAVDRVLAIATPSTRIVPGHGPLATREDLVAYRRMLATIGERVRAKLREGRTPEEIAASDVTAGFDDVWGKGFLTPPRFAQMVADNLRRTAP
jgi:cyclase